MSGRSFKAHRLSPRNADRQTGPDNYFQNTNLVPAPREENLYGGVNGATATAAVTFAKTENYSDEGVGGMKVAAMLHATAAVTVPAATLSLALYRSTETEDVLVATAQATLPQLSASATVNNICTYVDLPFSEDQILLANKVYIGTTLTPNAAIANSTLKVDLIKTGMRFEADLATNYLSSINTYMKTASESLSSANSTLTSINATASSANASLTAIDGNLSAIETLTQYIANVASAVYDCINTVSDNVNTTESTPLSEKYSPANLANSATITYTAPLTTQSYIISMDGYGGIGALIDMAGTTDSVTLNIFGTMDRAAAAGSERYYNINQEFDSAASTAGWTITTSAWWTLEDVAGISGFYNKIRFDIATTADATISFDYKLKQLL